MKNITSECFRILSTPIFMNKILFDSIMNYCQMKIEYQELTKDIYYGMRDYSPDFGLFTKEIFEDYLSNEEYLELYVPFPNKILITLLPKIKRYNKITKKFTFCKNGLFSLKKVGYIRDKETTLMDPEYGFLSYEMCIYNYDGVLMCLTDILLEIKTDIPYFHLWI